MEIFCCTIAVFLIDRETIQRLSGELDTYENY
jgi:hypothetical protein